MNRYIMVHKRPNTNSRNVPSFRVIPNPSELLNPILSPIPERRMTRERLLELLTRPNSSNSSSESADTAESDENN